jgi:hypothetical protein
MFENYGILCTRRIRGGHSRGEAHNAMALQQAIFPVFQRSMEALARDT